MSTKKVKRPGPLKKPKVASSSPKSKPSMTKKPVGKAAAKPKAVPKAKSKPKSPPKAAKKKPISKSKELAASWDADHNELEDFSMYSLSAPDQPIDYDIIESSSRRELIEKVRAMLYVFHDGSAWVPHGAAFEEDGHWYQTMLKFD